MKHLFFALTLALLAVACSSTNTAPPMNLSVVGNDSTSIPITFNVENSIQLDATTYALQIDSVFRLAAINWNDTTDSGAILISNTMSHNEFREFMIKATSRANEQAIDKLINPK